MDQDLVNRIDRALERGMALAEVLAALLDHIVAKHPENKCCGMVVAEHLPE
jgi:hypothetical protein